MKCHILCDVQYKRCFSHRWTRCDQYQVGRLQTGSPVVQIDKSGWNTCYRSGSFGEYDDHVITTVRGMGIEPIQWDVDSLDWKDYDAATITQRVTSSVGPGSIVLFHNAALHTPEALPDILEYLLGEGYEIVPISQLILDGEYGTDYTIDHTGRQCPVSS